MSDGTSLDQAIQLTQVGVDELRQELDELIKVRMPKIIERVANAREQGDLSENADYHSARDEQAITQARINEIEIILMRSVVVSNKKGISTVGMGSTVTIKLMTKTAKKITMTLVGEFEADPEAGKISVVSPMGKAMMGKKKGDQISVKAPAGEVAYEILEIK
ncbi:MAG TPA: transcription elongation factor GreA [Candidatus Pacebacteria bacterium]|nr:transcription elongation factor GreA [Candidatus Paceibacterota bacterium]